MPYGLVTQRGHIARAVLAVEEVQFVLQLHHDDGAAGRVLPLGEERQHLVEPGGDPVEEARLVLPDPELRVRAQPGGQRAAVPLGADVRARPRDDVQALLPREVEEGGHVAPALEGPAAGCRLVEVPRQVDVHAGVAGGPDLGEPGAPLLPGQAEVEQGRAQHELRTALDADTPGVELDDAVDHCRRTAATHLTPALPPLMSISYRYFWPR